ncbi:hypothetical protein [Vibrio genomosp. F10]|uniref:hypothetical protein n=1 Tax=Vibrio genomosp. F10 TaxID=723171 RepID=UPI00031C1A6D|nr:hypothetical protein [Vibrio genomosp. F10]
MSKYYDEVPFEYGEEIPATPGEVRGHGWSAKPQGSKFVLSFLSGALMGRNITIEISEADYTSAQEGTLVLDEICRKYSIS